MEKILAQNLAELMSKSPLGLTSQEKVAAATRGRVNQTTVGRILREQHKVTMKTLGALADAFDIEPYQLLILNLNPRNPQVLRALSPEEENLYKALEIARKGPGTQ